jgi:hypothetical protein
MSYKKYFTVIEQCLQSLTKNYNECDIDVIRQTILNKRLYHLKEYKDLVFKYGFKLEQFDPKRLHNLKPNWKVIDDLVLDYKAIPTPEKLTEIKTTFIRLIGKLCVAKINFTAEKITKPYYTGVAIYPINNLEQILLEWTFGKTKISRRRYGKNLLERYDPKKNTNFSAYFWTVFTRDLKNIANWSIIKSNSLHKHRTWRFKDGYFHISFPDVKKVYPDLS